MIIIVTKLVSRDEREFKNRWILGILANYESVFSREFDIYIHVSLNPRR